MTSSQSDGLGASPEELGLTPYRDVTLALAEREALCRKIAARAQFKGLDASWQMVNKNLRQWKLWYTGGLATGHLMKITGVKFTPRRPTSEGNR